MSGRKRKTVRRKATKVVEVPVEVPQVFFEDATLGFLRSVGQVMGGIKARGGGAQSLGPDALYACAVETLDQARNNAQGVRGYITAAAYALVAAMQTGGAWNLPLKPTSEQPTEPQEKPSDEAERGSE